MKAVLAEKRIQTLAPKTINGIIDSITIPLKWAFNEEYTENICYEGLRRKTAKSQERHILTMDEAENLSTATTGIMMQQELQTELLCTQACVPEKLRPFA